MRCYALKLRFTDCARKYRPQSANVNHCVETQSMNDYQLQSLNKKTRLHIQNNLGPLHMLFFILTCSPQFHFLFGFPRVSSTYRRPLRLRLGLAWVMEADLCKDWKVAQNLCFTGWLNTALIKSYHMYCKGMEWYVVIHVVVCYVL